MKLSLTYHLVPVGSVLLTVLAACESPPEPTPEPRPAGTQNTAGQQSGRPQIGQGAGQQKTQAQIQQERDKAAANQAAGGKRKINAKPAAKVKPSEDDPEKGEWTLEEATKGLKDVKDGNALIATIETSEGKLECRLFEDKAPITVANFIGLARGIRPWKNSDSKWVKEPAYDGTVFHRIIKGFMVQGGDTGCKKTDGKGVDIKRCGMGEPGYVIPDEVWEDAHHDRPGLLCMANRGPNTNGAQFFITDALAAHLDYNAADPRSSGYTIFGECGPVDLVHKIAAAEIEKGDRPKTAPEIKKITVARKKVEEKKADEKKTDEKAAPEATPTATPTADPKTPSKTSSDAKSPTTPGPKSPQPSDAKKTPPGPMAPRESQ
ncbi:MAG TPA: peptidylprolyl isomerase [Polyangiaceae bacterium]|nr:peptidylprolyl isomerase [Polyangiaceae bacterium]